MGSFMTSGITLLHMCVLKGNLLQPLKTASGPTSCEHHEGSLRDRLLAPLPAYLARTPKGSEPAPVGYRTWNSGSSTLLGSTNGAWFSVAWHTP